MPPKGSSIGDNLFAKNNCSASHRDCFEIETDNQLLQRILPQVRIIVELGNPGLENGRSAPKRSRQHFAAKTRGSFEDRGPNELVRKII